jgi:hypothetical protein
MLQLIERFFQHPLDTLKSEDAKRMFQHYADTQGQQNHELAELQSKIVERCAGLPLALRLIGAALADTRRRKDWEVSDPQGCGSAHAWNVLQPNQCS